MDFLKFLFSIFMNERGEEGDGTAGQGEEGDSEEEESGSSQQGKKGEGDHANDSADTPKYGQFGDNPTVNDVYDALNELNSSHDDLKGKTTRTEKNLAALRKAVESTGHKILMDSDGNVQLVQKDEPTKSAKKLRFTEKHADLWDQETLESVKFLIQDEIDTGIEEYKTSVDKKSAEKEKFIAVRRSSNQQMIDIYPQLNSSKNNKEFDEGFYERATEIWKEKYVNLPNGELIAAHEAALEIGVSATKIEKAKKEGYQRGQEGKKILGPVGTRSKEGGSGFKKLTKDEFLKLSSVEQDKYSRQQVLQT